MKDLRERCDKFHETLFGIAPETRDAWFYRAIESFALQIRNEALEEAYQTVMKHAKQSQRDGFHSGVAEEAAFKIKRLKTDALAASEDK